jgi:hypothetical protein
MNALLNKVNPFILALFSVVLLILPFQANAFEGDPCENIVGTWKGTATTNKCVWDVSAKFEKYKRTVHMDYYATIKSGNKECIKTENIVAMGTCKNAALSIDFGGSPSAKGFIFGDNVYLRINGDPLFEIKLNKN